MSKEIAAKSEASVLMESWKDDLSQALPTNIPYDRMRSTFITAVAHNPDILTCDPDSIRTALLKCANDRLMPDNREAALVPYNTDVKEGNAYVKKKLCQYLPMVAGIRKRAKELGGIRSIICEVVHDKDHFEQEAGDDPKIVHRPPRLGQDRGEIIGAYAIFKDDTDFIVHREVMDIAAINTARDVSRAKDGPAWKKFFGEMSRKTVLRRGAKSIPSMPEELRTIIERDDEMTDFQVDRSRRTIDAHANPLLDNSGDRDRVRVDTKQRDGDKVSQQTHSDSSKNQIENSHSKADTSQRNDEEKDGGSQSGDLRLGASVFEEYTTTLLRYSSESSVKKGAGQFWTSERPFPTEVKDDALARKIYDLHMDRAKGDMASDEMQKKVGELIVASYK